jgi:nucleotide-binding universal stress UspA family protein
MTAFRRVVVGFDGSAPGGDALALGRRLVDRDDGELVVAHIDATRSFRLPHGRRPPPAGEVLQQALDALGDGDGLRVRTIDHAASSAARGLTEVAEAERADLLVLGAHHATPERRTTPGPTAFRLLQGAPCAVAVAPLGVRERERFHHVGVAYDGGEEATAALHAAYALAARDGAAVSLYRAIAPRGTAYPGAVPGDIEAAAQSERNLAQDQLDTAADAAPAGVNPRTVLLRGEPGAEIARASDGIVDVLFAGSRGYGPMHRAFAGSVSETLLRSAVHPVILMPRGGVAVESAPEGVPAPAP